MTNYTAKDVAMAERLWPDNPTLQHLWLRAVQLVRSTSRGWLLDRPINRSGHAPG